LRSVREHPFWDTFLFANLRDLHNGVDPALLEMTGEDKWWDELISQAFMLRPLNASHRHSLSADARKVFVRFFNDHRSKTLRLPQCLQRLASRLPEQALKIALILHLASDEPDDVEIGVDVMGIATTLASRLGNNGLQSGAALFGVTPVVVEDEVEKMVAKLKLHGPQRKRDLFRRYDSQDYGRLEPLLNRALENNLVTRRGEFFASAN
jgi:hypothetical protein